MKVMRNTNNAVIMTFYFILVFRVLTPLKFVRFHVGSGDFTVVHACRYIAFARVRICSARLGLRATFDDDVTANMK